MSMIARYERDCKGCGNKFFASFVDEDRKYCDNCQDAVADKVTPIDDLEEGE